jgi:hypothetical protein
MNINSIINRAVAGVDSGLNNARNISSQLNYGAPQPEEDENNTAVSRVEKAGDSELGRIIDESA